MLTLLLKLFAVLVGLSLLLAVAAWLYLQLPQFAKPELDRTRLGGKHSVTDNSRYNDGRFSNIEPTEVMVTTDTSAQPRQGMLVTLYKFLFAPTPGSIPDAPMPSRKTDLLTLERSGNQVVWMGHSTYFVQLEGKRLLIDPVFSRYASPVPGTNGAFAGTNIYDADDIPELDYLLITHDHWDHLDYPSVQALRHKVKRVITPMGVGSYFRQWGWPAEQVFEGDWGSQFEQDGLTVHILPARHFSGRLLDRNRTLWGSFALITDQKRYYFGGDSGYGQHFRRIGDAFGPFDLAVLECGQYNQQWASIHMMPEQTAQAATDLQARKVLAAHNSKFKLSHHHWKEPLERISAASVGQSWQLLTPLIGEAVDIDDDNQQFDAWWKAAGAQPPAN